MKHTTKNGTSPRLWGKRNRERTDALEHRNIPTLVGKTISKTIQAVRKSEHPHACGENRPGTPTIHSNNGTSPRLWGKLYGSINQIIGSRNIPTLVGKTGAGENKGGPLTEHPHACGENVVMAWDQGNVFGTSPRLWGKRHDDGVVRVHSRNIPTLVGKTSFFFSFPGLKTEHPHACGENRRGGDQRVRLRGTSPRLWGKRNG